MLLRADGSMTVLLEALVGRPLALDLTDQHLTTARSLAPPVRTALGCGDGDPVVVRRSVLVTGDGVAVSRNRVSIVATDRELTELLTDEHLPIGHSLAAGRRHLARTVLGTGFTHWAADGEPGPHCAYKESVLSDHRSIAVAHLHECFNPAVVPLGARR